MEQSEKLMAARCRLMTRSPFYGQFALSMVWLPSEMSWKPEEQRTMGVRIVNGGEVQCIYYPPFVEKLTLKELYAVIQHEIEHILRIHCIRTGSRDPQIWNIAADYTVNGPKNKPRIGYNDEHSNSVIVPFKGQICWIPADWAQDESAEHYYEKLLKEVTGGSSGSCSKGGGKGKGKQKGKGGGGQGDEDDEDGDGEGGGNDGGGERYKYGRFGGHAIDDHSTWGQSDVSEDEARQVIKDMAEQAVAKSQGHVPGHLAEILKALGQPIVKWRELLRHYLGKHVGNQRITYSRRNRRYDQFGVPGVSHHAAAKVNCIIDTSGSVGTRELEQFFAEIDAIAYRAKVNVLQWDHAFQGFGKYKRGAWKGFKVHGRGGTDMAAPIQWLIDQRLIADVQVMLTDGYCNWFDGKNGFPMITCITSAASETKDPPFGHVVRLRADS